jgi:hypothetical protein
MTCLTRFCSNPATAKLDRIVEYTNESGRLVESCKLFLFSLFAEHRKPGESVVKGVPYTQRPSYLQRVDFVKMSLGQKAAAQAEQVPSACLGR